MWGRRAAVIGIATALAGVLTGPLLFGCPTVAVAPAAEGTTPGENGKIVFAADLGQGFQLFTIKPNGDGLHQLTNVDREASRPDWSPDGNRLAFELFQLSNGEHAGVAIMNADGSDMVDLTPTGINAEPAWTPDGQQLVYECPTCVGGDGIFVINEDGTDPRRLTTNPFPDGFDTDPNVSPDGQTVTFVRVRKDGREQALFAVDLDGGNERKLTSFGLEVGAKHDWAPDGRHIVITRDADYPHGRSPNVATIRPNGSQLRMLTTYEDEKRGAFSGSYSPDGRWIVFRVENLDSQTFRLLKMRPDGTHRTLIATLPFAPRNMDWGST